jgi:hypothetical protein
MRIKFAFNQSTVHLSQEVGAKISQFDIVTSLLKNGSSVPCRAKIIFPHSSIQTSSGSHCLIQFVLGAVSPGLWYVCLAGHSPLSMLRLRMVKLYLHSPVYLHGMVCT